jgi:hypothetical protein
MDLSSDSSYTLNFYIRPGAVNTVQKLDVTVGVAANPLAVISTVTVPNPTVSGYSLVSIPITVPAPGFYHIGFNIGSTGSAPTFKIDDIEMTTLAVGINNNKLDASVNVYPNPANTNVVVSIRNTKDVEYLVTITDLLGRTVKTMSTEKVASTDLNIDLSDVANGAYLVKVQSGNAVKSAKLIINK